MWKDGINSMTRAMKTYLDWSAYKDAGLGDAYADIPKHGGDFAKAVAVCINSRQCEADGKQVMCPSYRVSGNPMYSTGGRVRMLKAALGEDMTEQALAKPVLAEAMELCVACKGCKRECENNVDMALIKAEYMAQKHARQGLSRRSKLFAETPRWLHEKPWMGALVRLRNNNALVAKVTEKVFGLAAHKTMPEPVSKPFVQTEAIEGQADRPSVVLLVDTFSRYYEPAIAEAALAVLKAGGYAVSIATPEADDAESKRPLCCGRTYLAQGLIDQARAEAGRLVRAVLPHVQAGHVVVGMEASCVLGLRDDAKALGLGEDLETVAASTLLFEEFLAKEIMAKRLDLPLKTLPGKTLVHGHCHQKAVGAMKAMRRVLKLVPDHDFEMIEAGCCGMAGTFGLEAEHAAMADDMADLALTQALKAAPEAIVVANGFSCRQQIKGHSDHRPKHLAVLLAEALEKE